MFIILQMSCNARENMFRNSSPLAAWDVFSESFFFNDFMNKQKFSFVCNNHTTLSHLKLNFVVTDVRFESWRASRR